MKRAFVALLALVIVAAAVPWAIGWRAEQLVRDRVAQLDADKTADIRVRIDSYERGWRGASAKFSVVEREGEPLLTLAAAIRHWPFASGGPAEWVAVPELGNDARDALGPWGEKLPELTVRTTLGWRGDLVTRIESAAFKRRVPEVAGGTLEIAAIAGTVDWRRDGALSFDLALPVFRVERRTSAAAGAPDVIEFKEALLKGEGFVGAAERRWNQKGSLAAESVSIMDAGTPVFAAATPRLTYETRDEGEYVAMQLAFAVTSVNARHALQNLSDAAVEFSFDARHLAKEPLARLHDLKADEKTRQRAAASASQLEEVAHDLMRNSPAADVRFALKAREGRIEVTLALAFDGLGLEPKANLDDQLQRLAAELNARATTSLVVAATRAGADAAVGLLPSPGRKENTIVLPDAPTVDPDAAARRHLNEAAAQGFIRFEGDEVATTVRWRRGQLIVNGRDMSMLRELARGMTGR